MTIYEIDARLNYIAQALEPDENGEFHYSIEDLEKLDEEHKALLITKQEKLEGLTRWYFNLSTEAETLKAESARLKARADSFKNKAESIKNFISYICNGENTELGIAKGYFRTNKSLSVTDSAAAIKYLENHGHKDCIKYTDPEIKKDDVKALINNNESVPGTEITESQSFSIR